MFVGRLMSSPAVTTSGDATLRDAAATMRERGVGSLVVVADGALAGIVTRTDFVRAAAAGRDPTATAVDAYATEVVETTTANTPVEEAARVMVDRGVHHLPVVGDEDDVVGMVTSADFAAYLSER